MFMWAYLSPPPLSKPIASICASSSSVNVTRTASKFSCRCLMLHVPGMGTTSAPCACTHANASWPIVHPFDSAIGLSSSTSCKFFSKCSSDIFGIPKRRKSCSPKASSLRERSAPVKNPLPSGEYATILMPSSRQVGRRSLSMSRVHREYSCSMQKRGAVACARRRLAALASDSPIALAFPSSTMVCIAATLSSMGVVGETRQSTMISIKSTPRVLSAYSVSSLMASLSPRITQLVPVFSGGQRVSIPILTISLKDDLSTPSMHFFSRRRLAPNPASLRGP
mmetsp:Transcript_31852/g.53522  ORF Transcript_31852/g.53522 Transcript_31852/m.53522 type:complete len:281 (-) Transcript_31852:649-1491(-)